MSPPSTTADGDESSLARDGTAAEGASGDAARTAAVVIRRPIRTDPREVADLVLGWARDRAGEGDAAAVGNDAIRTLSAFLDRPDDGRDALVWYVEVDATTLPGAWAAPADTVRDAVESEIPGLVDHLAPAGASRVLGDGTDGSVAVVHEGIRARPGAVGTHPDHRPVVVAAGEGDPPDVVAVRVRAAAPLGEWFLRGFARVVTALPEDGWLERRFRRASRSVLEEERMFTESILLERTDDDYFLWWYMEAADMDRVTEAYEASGNAVARASDAVLDRVVVDPSALFDPVQASRHEPLVHVVDPERPGFGARRDGETS